MELSVLREFIRPELMVLIPVLYLIGAASKKSKWVDDRHIPLILGGAGIALSLLYVSATCVTTGWRDVVMMVFTAFTQGILAAGCSVYANQIYKQSRKEKDHDGS